MSTTTPNFGFTKPATGDKVNVADLNGNFDLIDAGVEPIHDTRTVTGSNGSITISNALDAPLLRFSAVGMGAPTVIDATEMGGVSAQGQQTWSTPLVMDVSLGVIDGNGDPVFLDYGGGVGANSYSPTSGEETGTLVYFNSKQIVKLFEAADDSGATYTNEGRGFHLFECPLPFSVASGSTVYCSHLRNENVSESEGIWADGDTLYLRVLNTHCGGDDFSKFAAYIEAIARVNNYYTPMAPVGFDPENFFDFFVMMTASASYTKSSDEILLSLDNGSQMMAYFKISDYIATLSEEEPDVTPIASMSATYYLDSAVNRAQQSSVNAALKNRFAGVAALGKDAVAEHGGAVGEGAAETYGGGAVGYYAKAATGGAVGVGASSIKGQGGAVGMDATAIDGGAVGYQAKTSDGCAIGRYAVCKDSHNDPIDAIQLGTGTNATTKSMQVYGTQLLYYDSTNNTHYIPLSLITASYNAATASEKNDFDLALGNIVRYSITNDLIGAGIGTFVKLTSDGTVSEAGEDGDVFIGQLAEVPSSGANTALVRIKGVMETEAMLGLGLQRVAFSDGTLDISANGREIFVTSRINGRVTFIV